MRICSPQLGISPNSILGGEIYDREILKHLALEGVDIEVLLPLTKAYPHIPNLHITRVPVPFVVPPHIFNVFILPQLLYLFQQKPFDILRVHSPTFVGLAAAVFKKLHPQIPIVGIYHWLGEGGRIEQMIDPYLLRNVFDLVICDSFYTKKQLKKKFEGTKNKIHVIHNGVDEILKPAKKSLSLMKKYGILPSTTTLLFMGLFIDRKNPLFLLSLIRSLIDKNFPVKLLLCGKGPLEDEIKKQIQALDLSNNIFIVPSVFGNEKKKLFNLADIFVHPAKQEGFSLSVIEAMACGLPVIITNGFSAAEAVTHKVNGLLCNNKYEWENAISLFITNPKLKEKISKANIARVKKEFQWSSIARKHEILFKTLT